MALLWVALLILACSNAALPPFVNAQASASAPSPASVPSPASASSPAPAPGPPPYVNVTGTIDVPRQYSRFLALLTETGADKIFQAQADNITLGITVFAPTDDAYGNFTAAVGNLANYTADQKLALALYHALPQHVNLAGLQNIVDPVTRTRATLQFGGGEYGSGYTINVTQTKKDIILVSSGNIHTMIITTMENSALVSIFGISEVLRPVELFGMAATPPAPAPTPDMGAPPSSSPALPLTPGTSANSTTSTNAGGPSTEGKSASTLHMHSSLFVFLISFLSFYFHVL